MIPYLEASTSKLDILIIPTIYYVQIGWKGVNFYSNKKVVSSLWKLVIKMNITKILEDSY